MNLFVSKVYWGLGYYLYHLLEFVGRDATESKPVRCFFPHMQYVYKQHIFLSVLFY